MNSIGMISQYDHDSNIGAIMFAQGKKIPFTFEDWSEQETTPMIGLKVVCSVRNNQLSVSLAQAIDEITEAPDLSENGDGEEGFADMDTLIAHYTQMGFKLARDGMQGSSRSVSLRYFTPQDFAEVIALEREGKLTISYKRNGNNVDAL